MDDTVAVVASPIGKLGIVVEQQRLTTVKFLPARQPLQTATDPLAKKIINALTNYFTKKSYHFDFPISLTGTTFQKKVWQALQAIPTGHTLSYGQLATKLKTSPRAIGNACRENPIAIIIPCHRIVSQTGLGGYSGQTQGEKLRIKQFLLELEN